MPSPTRNFDGVGTGFGTYTVSSAPPDSNAAVGPNHVIETVNTDLAIFNKSGTVVLGPKPINTLWAGFGGGCQTNNDGDPTVVYDRMADRWLISQFSVNTTPYLECVAVSKSPDPTGAYWLYSFAYNDFPDYPKLSVWPDAYYATFNMFAGGTTFSGGTVCAYDRTKMLAGQAATQQCFNVGTSFGGLLAANLDSSALPPASSPEQVLSLGALDGQLASWRFHVDWTTPASSTLTGPTTLTTAPYTLPCGDSGGTCVPQSGTSQQLDTLGDRLMYRLAYRNFGDHESLVVTHSVTAGTSTGMRWYELRLDGGHNPSIFQQGTYAPDANFRWMGSIAMDRSGNMALGFSLSGSALHPQIHYTGRLAGDPAGQMPQGEASIINGAGSQTGSNLSRWGDYTSMAVDPTDDCTFWYTNEYLQVDGAFNWSTRIASFTYPSCAAAPPSVTINPKSGPAHTAVTLSGGGFGAGEQVTMKYLTGLSAPKPASVTLCTATATPAGTFSCHGTIPSASTAGAHAIHKIVAKGHTSLRNAKTTFRLT